MQARVELVSGRVYKRDESSATSRALSGNTSNRAVQAGAPRWRLEWREIEEAIRSGRAKSGGVGSVQD